MLIMKDVLFADWFFLPKGGAAPNEAKDVPPPGCGLGWGDLVNGYMFLSSACHLPNSAALQDRVRNI